jgi:hypothetical protein
LQSVSHLRARLAFDTTFKQKYLQTQPELDDNEISARIDLTEEQNSELDSETDELPAGVIKA